MRVIKKYMLAKVILFPLTEEQKSLELFLPYEHQEYHKKLFDSEEEAIAWAYEFDSYGNYVILPVVSFEIFPELDAD